MQRRSVGCRGCKFVGRLPSRVSLPCPRVTCRCLAVRTHHPHGLALAHVLPTSQVVNFAFDGDIHTKWLDYAGGEDSWVTVAVQSPQAVTTYGVVSANDASSRDPKDWVLSASADAQGATWVELDRQQGVSFTAREQRHAFQVNAAGTSYQLYRLNVTALAGSPTEELMQVAEIELWFGDGCHDPCCGVDCGSHGTCDGATGACTCVRACVCVSVCVGVCRRVYCCHLRVEGVGGVTGLVSLPAALCGGDGAVS
jgi:hypothetical protein